MFKEIYHSQTWWYTPVIPASLEVETGALWLKASRAKV
jgi:hypothetical protein